MGLKVYDEGQDGKDKFTFFVIDRMDLVGLRVIYFMNELVKVVRDEGVRVKVFAVVDTIRGDWDEDLCVVDERVLVVQGNFWGCIDNLEGRNMQWRFMLNGGRKLWKML